MFLPFWVLFSLVINSNKSFKSWSAWTSEWELYHTHNEVPSEQRRKRNTMFCLHIHMQSNNSPSWLHVDIMQYLPSTFCICIWKDTPRNTDSLEIKITILLLTAFDKMVMRHSFISGCSLATGFSILFCYNCHAQKMHYLEPFLRYPVYLRIHYLL